MLPLSTEARHAPGTPDILAAELCTHCSARSTAPGEKEGAPYRSRKDDASAGHGEKPEASIAAGRGASPREGIGGRREGGGEGKILERGRREGERGRRGRKERGEKKK
eukprot:scaffold85540_cov33-Tisochrysis_lutea.AAC.1